MNPIKPAKITIRNILAILQAFVRKRRRNLGGFSLPSHIYEQIIWRRTEVIQKSPECWKGNCIWCGCEILGKTMEDRACEKDDDIGSCYPYMMDKYNWQKFKELHKIELFN